MDAGNYIKGLEKHVDELKEARDEWKEKSERFEEDIKYILSEIKEHGVMNELLNEFKNKY